MREMKFSLIVVLVAISSLYSAEPQARAPLPGDQINLVCLGDSHTENGVYAKVLYQTLVNAGRGAEKSRCYGFGGRTAADLIGMVKADKLEMPLDPKAVNVVSLMIGTNGYNVADQKTLVEMISKRGWYVLVLTAPPRRGPNTNSGAGGPGSNGGYNDEVRKTYPKLTPGKLLPVQVVDIVPPLLDKELIGRGEWTDNKYNADGVHLNAEGYTLLGKTVADALLNIFPKK